MRGACTARATAELALTLYRQWRTKTRRHEDGKTGWYPYTCRAAGVRSSFVPVPCCCCCVAYSFASENGRRCWSWIGICSGCNISAGCCDTFGYSNCAREATARVNLVVRTVYLFWTWSKRGGCKVRREYWGVRPSLLCKYYLTLTDLL